MRKTFKYKAKINKITENNCLQWLNLCRYLYNTALEQRIFLYKQRKKSISMFEQMKQLKELKQIFPEYKKIGSQCLQDVLERLDKAYKGFFQRAKEKSGNAGFPRFKSRSRYDSFTLKQTGWKLEGRNLYISNIGRFKLFLSRPIEGKVKTVTVHYESTDKWFVCFSCEDISTKKLPEIQAEIGIDVGIKSFCADSEGNVIENPKYLNQSLKILRRKQRSLSRKKKGSNRRSKTRKLVAKCHEKISNQRNDFLHKTANHYIKNYQRIYIESLNIKGMVHNRHLSRSINDCAWGIFFNLLQYKAEGAGREVIKVKPHNTSQICSGCGMKVLKSLSVRTHKCPFCNLVIDRDLNASLNILAVGQTAQVLNIQKDVCLRIS